VVANLIISGCKLQSSQSNRERCSSLKMHFESTNRVPCIHSGYFQVSEDVNWL